MLKKNGLLGGHLATAFNLLHQDEKLPQGENLIKATYTFNGAGIRNQTTGIGYRLRRQ